MTLDTSRHVRLTLSIAATLLLSAGATAQTAADLTRVEINARKANEQPRLDVRAACPDIDQSLPLALATLWQRIQSTGTVDVQFDLNGDQPAAVSTRGGPRDYHPAIRRAVRALSCANTGSETQRYAFQIVFRDEPEDSAQPGRQIIALLQLR